MIRFDYHFRRTRQHRLFALSAACPSVHRSHEQLAQVHWAVVSFIHLGKAARRPA
jgi:4-hydroxy-3-methylbut-2-enyl diphosphate reductase IspH